MSETFEHPYASKALLANYVRHVEAAFESYRRGRECELKFITNEGRGIRTYEFLAASSAFEHCISNMHRAIVCMRSIARNRVVPQPIRALFANRPSFIKPATADIISGIRDAVQHTFEQIAQGKIAPNSAYVLSAGGPETIVEDGEPPQTLKTFDRLSIGHHEIKFEQVKEILVEMGDCAERLATYNPHISLAR